MEDRKQQQRERWPRQDTWRAPLEVDQETPNEASGQWGEEVDKSSIV